MKIINKTVINEVRGRARKFNRTTSIVNVWADVRFQIDDTFRVNSDYMAFHGNEYRKIFSMNNDKLCSYLVSDRNLYFKSLSKFMNIADPTTCPFPNVCVI